VSRAVVFAYHDVGVRCLRALLDAGVEVPLVVTHRDDPKAQIWFASVAALARERGIPAVLDPANEEIRALIDAPDFIFSFYYRRMLPVDFLQAAKRGAYNMHGSLLPKNRGRAPVNWAVQHGERETGASLHYMAAKPDAGDLVAQAAVPILPDDTAREVFDKVTVAAECVLDRALPGIVAGTAPRQPLDLAQGSYFGGRRPEDGRIDWTQDAPRIHNLVRAVAPPYPGAFTEVRGHRLRVLRTRVLDDAGGGQTPRLVIDDTASVARCGGGGVLLLLDVEVDGRHVAPHPLASLLGAREVPL
jgi:methionyl-tRNA formyltransferase